MTPDESAEPDLSLRGVTRRHFFTQCGVGVGSIALASLLRGDRAFAESVAFESPMKPRAGHFPARAKNVIFLFMAGGPSQLELFDWKPKLVEMTGTPVPDSFMAGRRFAFMDSFFKNKPNLLGTRRKFAQYGNSGTWVSELMPKTAEIVDQICLLKTLQTDVPNHAPAKILMNTGVPRFGRPSMGSWLTYGIGSESSDLPGFVVLLSGPRGPRGGAMNWSCGFLPAAYQGVPLRSQGDPILSVASPPGTGAENQRQVIDAVNALNRQRLEVTGDSEIAARIAAYEMAYRMQSSAPELMDLGKESAETLQLYGAQPGTPSFALNCLLARRLVERGVRFVQLYHTNWDHHGGPAENLDGALEGTCRDVDQASAALVLDLQQRGLLDETLVIWGGEFGRTPMGEPRETIGRNHHMECGVIWLAGGGVQPGITIGETDELGFLSVEDPVHVHDLQATILHLMGLDHTRLTYRYNGRDFRLTDVGGNVVKKILSA